MALITDLRAQMLLQIGESASAAEASLLARLLNDINAVGQSLYSTIGSWWRDSPAGSSFRAPTSVTGITMTAGSTSIASAGLESWMNGCACRITGQSALNYLKQTGASTWAMVMPHDGSSTTTGTMTVYHDCVTLASGILSIERPVILADYWELSPVEGTARLQGSTGNMRFGAGRYTTSSWWPWGRDRWPSAPLNYTVDGTTLYGGTDVLQLRFNPLPDRAYQIHWRQTEGWTKVADWNDTRTEVVPHGYHESIFIPLLLERLIGRPNFQGDKDAVRQDADAARKIMERLSRPQSNHRLRISTLPVN